MISRRQVLGTGATPGWLAARLAAGQWDRLLPGTYVVHRGPVEPLGRVWSALLYAGDGSVASHGTAAWLWGVVDEPPTRIDVAVPAHRRVRGQPGLRLHLVDGLAARTHPTRRPGLTLVEDTVLDLVDAARRDEDVVGVVTAACQRRLTTPARIEAAAARRKRLRLRALVRELVAEVADGALSPLELRWARDVDRAHRLPPADRNAADRGRYRDVRYRHFPLVVELDGRPFHLDVDADRARDRELLVGSDVRTLRYGWGAVISGPCLAARDVACVLTRLGWGGTPSLCGAGCLVRS